ncbi:MAG: hypothetical protein JWO52_5352 [Gammaproteobacteria bacterium]|nr:hypothetical protein [Gammaproteobacteria bacterium]
MGTSRVDSGYREGERSGIRIRLVRNFEITELDMNDEIPAWLKAVQNGSIGEARTRAFLLDRFWVLERSVDIDGADFIIERRLTRQTLLDRAPPRFGVVQVKFFASAGTTQYVHEEYVKDPEGKPRSEFFLICHTGDEEEARAFLMTAQDIVDTFEVVTEGTREGKYRIGGAQLLGSNQFAISNRRRALDRVERALQAADFATNRSFMSWLLPSARLDAAAIDPLYREPIDNNWGDIPTGFLDLKKTAQRAMFDLEEIHEKLGKIVESTDPEDAFKVLKKVDYECRSGYGWNVSLPDDLFNSDFQQVAREHKEKVTALRSRGLLDAFLGFNETLKNQFAMFLAPLMPIAGDRAHVVSVRYDPETLTNVFVQSRVEDAEKYWDGTANQAVRRADGVIEAKPGLIRYWWIPGIYAADEALIAKGWESYVKEKFWSPYRDLMNALYAIHFGDPD